MPEKSPKPVSYTFERIEKKYWMTQEQYQALWPLLQENLQPDGWGLKKVCNIYYDTPDYRLIRRSIERPKFKEKLRLRSYGLPDENTVVFIELKRKLNGIGYKRRIAVPFRDAKRLLNGEPVGCSEKQIELELLEFVRRYGPQPMVYLTYERYAMLGKDGSDLRVTLDSHLRWSLVRDGAPDPERMMPIMGDDTRVLLELKALGAIPFWLQNELSRLHIYQAPFSKIGTCFTNHIAPGLKFPPAMKG